MLVTLLTPEQLVELDRRIGARADALIAVRQRAKPQTLTKTTNRGRPSKSIHNPFFSFIGYGTSYERYPQFAMDIVEGIARLDWHDRAIGSSGKSMPLSVRNLMVTLESLPAVSTAAVGELLGDVSVQGYIAKTMYVSLYRLHQATIHGYTQAGLLTMKDLLTRRVRPKIKLY